MDLSWIFMGSYNSQRMVDDESFSSSTSGDDSDTGANYAQLFQRIINRYTNNRRSMPISEDNFDGLSRRPPKIKYIPNTSKLDTSEFYNTTKRDSGCENPKKPFSISMMILNRERGRYRYDSFSREDRNRITNCYLPNEMERMQCYEGKVFCGIFSRDGKLFATASQDQMIRLYNTDNGKFEPFKTFQARDVGWSIIDIAFSPDQQYVAYSTWSSALHLCTVNGDPDKQEPLNLVSTARRFCVFSLAFSSDGREILGGANDGVMCIFDRQRNTRILKIKGHEFDINSVAFADDSSHIIYSGSDDGLVKVWDRRTLGEDKEPKPVGILAGHLDGITFINAKGDGRHLISNSKDQSIKLWDVRVFSSDRAAKKSLKVVQQQSWDYRWQGVPKQLYNVKDRLEGDTSIMTYKGHVITRTLIRCRFSPLETTGQRYIYTGCGGGRLVIYDALTGKVQRDERKHQACIRDVSWHPYNNEIYTSSWDCSVGRWFYQHTDIKDKSEKRKNPEPPRRSPRIAYKKLREKHVSSASND